MKNDSSYHHGDLRGALVKAAVTEIERGGYENLSLRELAKSLGVSRAAPYRHFADRRALLAAVAADGFDRLTAIYRNAIANGKTPQARLAAAGRAYLAFAAERPQLFRLMFVSDLLGQSMAPPDPGLIKSAGNRTLCSRVSSPRRSTTPMTAPSRRRPLRSCRPATVSRSCA